MAFNDKVLSRALRYGIGILQPKQGLLALRAAMAGTWQSWLHSSTVAAVPFSWSTFLQVACPAAPNLMQ